MKKVKNLDKRHPHSTSTKNKKNPLFLKKNKCQVKSILRGDIGDRLIQEANELIEEVELTIKFNKISSDKSIDAIITDINYKIEIIGNLNIDEKSPHELKEILTDSLVDCVLPARKILFNFSFFKLDAYSNFEELQYNLSVKTFNFVNVLYEFYLINETKIEIIKGRPLQIELHHLIRSTNLDSEYLDNKNELLNINLIIQSKKNLTVFYSTENAFFCIRRFLFLLLKIKSDIYSLSLQICDFKISEMRNFILYPPLLESIEITRANIRKGSDELNNNQILLYDCTSSILKSKSGSPNLPASILEYLIEWLKNVASLQVESIGVIKSMLISIKHISDPEMKDKSKLLLGQQISSLKKDITFLEDTYIRITKYKNNSVFSEKINQKIIQDALDLVIETQAETNRSYKDLFDSYVALTGNNHTTTEIDIQKLLYETDSFLKQRFHELSAKLISRNNANAHEPSSPPTDSTISLSAILPTFQKYFPLIKACRTGNIAEALKQVESGIDIHYNNEQALSDAVVFEHFDIADLLIKNGSNLKICGQYIISCLDETSSIDSVAYIFSHGLDVRVVGADYLYTALENHSFKIAKSILTNGASINANDGMTLQKACYKEDYEVLDFLFENDANIHVGSEKALMTACKKGSLKLVKYLISKGADVHQNESDLLTEVCTNTEDDLELLSYVINELGMNIELYKTSLLNAAQYCNNAKIYSFLKNDLQDTTKKLH